VPFFESRASLALITTSFITAAVGIAIPFTRSGVFLGFIPLLPIYCIALLLILLGYVVLTHLTKM